MNQILNRNFKSLFVKNVILNNFDGLKQQKSFLHSVKGIKLFNCSTYNSIVFKSSAKWLNSIWNNFLTRTTIHSTNSASSNFSSINNGALTVSKSKRVMRLIYAQVHPDLFTNYLQAQVSSVIFCCCCSQ